MSVILAVASIWLMAGIVPAFIDWAYSGPSTLREMAVYFPVAVVFLPLLRVASLVFPVPTRFPHTVELVRLAIEGGLFAAVVILTFELGSITAGYTAMALSFLFVLAGWAQIGLAKTRDQPSPPRNHPRL